MAVQRDLRENMHSMQWVSYNLAEANYEDRIFYSELYNILTMATSVNIFGIFVM
jgi:hypothetical protein